MATVRKIHDYQYKQIPLRSIHKMHSVVQRISQNIDLDLLYLPYPAQTEISRKALHALLEQYPMRVVANGKDRYQLIGGIRQWTLSNFILDCSAEIPVLLHKGRLTKEYVLQQIIAEILYFPLFAGSHEDGSFLQRYKIIQDRVGQLENDLGASIANTMITDSQMELARMLGISKRKLQSMLKNAAS